MSRINIEDSLFKDNRFINLVLKLGSRRLALGAMTECYIVAQKFWIKCNGQGIPIEEWKKECLEDLIIEVGLSTVNDRFVYVHGSKEQFKWLEQRSNAGSAKKGKKNKKSNARSKKEDPFGITEELNDRPSTDVNGSERLETSSSSSYSYSDSSSVSKNEKNNYSSAEARKSRLRGAISPFDSDSVCVLLLKDVLATAQEAWLKAYPSPEWLIEEIALAHSWCESNPDRRPKNFQRFLSNWFNRGFEKYRKGLPSLMTTSDKNALRLAQMYKKAQEEK